MAFNFNWSPLTADSSFYSRAQELLTIALNKSPKPPIIVDEIIVNELNLGSVPPDLEILEIGDLAEDRFRGIFKMCYSGDAFLTLKTRVQANPLNTYLSAKPEFTSPQPLAASSGLTIPLQITLSEIKLSAFIILVFSRQKGLTLVFRNDPLESLRVSSTFDSIPFVRDYLQKEIEGQLRVLLMEEVPAIIHRLSLRLWVPEYRAGEDEELARAANSIAQEEPADPFASPSHGPIHIPGDILDSQISLMSLDSQGSETQSLFSQKNLIRLDALADAQRTLALSTPTISDVVFRAWASATERGEGPGTNTPATPSLSRTHSVSGSMSSTYSFTSSVDGYSSRPTLRSYGSAVTGLSLGAGRPSRHTNRKKKNRIVNLRKSRGSSDTDSVSGESTSSATSSMTPTSEPVIPKAIFEEKEEEIVTPPMSPRAHMKWRSPGGDSIDLGDSPVKRRPVTPVPSYDTLRPAERSDMRRFGSRSMRSEASFSSQSDLPVPSAANEIFQPGPPLDGQTSYPQEKSLLASSSTSNLNLQWPNLPIAGVDAQTSGILERAWVMKMAGEIARRANEEKASNRDFWGRADQEESPPPAYGAY
ncbi:MAG: ERMES complex subunit [Vezdaea acicularis]|nr:MAG: ERMES complex subunit [Vezdaea acicularis]